MRKYSSGINWRSFEAFLLSHGCVFLRENGQHRIYSKKGLDRPIVVSRADSLPWFAVMSNLRSLGLTKKDYEGFVRR